MTTFVPVLLNAGPGAVFRAPTAKTFGLTTSEVIFGGGGQAVCEAITTLPSPELTPIVIT